MNSRKQKTGDEEYIPEGRKRRRAAVAAEAKITPSKRRRSESSTTTSTSPIRKSPLADSPKPPTLENMAATPPASFADMPDLEAEAYEEARRAKGGNSSIHESQSNQKCLEFESFLSLRGQSEVKSEPPDYDEEKSTTNEPAGLEHQKQNPYEATITDVLARINNRSPSPTVSANIIGERPLILDFEGNLQTASSQKPGRPSKLSPALNDYSNGDSSTSNEQVADMTMPKEVKVRMLTLMQEEKYRVCWDPTHPQCRSRNTITDAYDALGDQLKHEGFAVKSSFWLKYNFNALTSSYRRCLLRMQTLKKKNSDSKGWDVNVTPQWKYFDLMEKLKPKDSSNVSLSFPMDDFMDAVSPTYRNLPSTSRLIPAKLVGKANSDNQPSSSSSRSANLSTFGPVSALIAQQHLRTDKPDSASDARHTIDSQRNKSNIDKLASTLVSLCDTLEEKQAGASAEFCIDLSGLIQKATKKLYGF